ncbi:MAG: glutamate 5-kinase [Lachnospiraceae bacterium]|nr:glutamate 5-kinase [Lachnospiraceae bacterium]MBQ9465221.1 glutamate 5-kinase [Lachnospiraceae bacterium]
MQNGFRDHLKDKKRIVIKIGTSSLTHKETNYLNLRVIESLARILTDLRNRGIDVALVSSGAIAVGRQSMHIDRRPATVAEKQALAAVGQAQLIMAYERVFSMYNQDIAQILITKYTFLNDMNRENALNTFHELFAMNVVPVINENDTVATHEIEFGDNDRLGAIVAALTGADLLILLTDTDGLYTADPSVDPTSARIPEVSYIDDQIMSLATGTNSDVGTGGMAAKLFAAQMAAAAGADVVIAKGDDPLNIHRILDGEDIGTMIMAHKNPEFDLKKYIQEY